MDERLEREPDLLVVNALYPPVDAVAGAQDPDPLTALWLQRRDLNERELERLDEAWSGPRLELPPGEMTELGDFDRAAAAQRRAIERAGDDDGARQAQLEEYEAGRPRRTGPSR